MIEVRGLKKIFTTPAGELPVLKGIDLRINKGELAAVVGASGVGKSTFLHILGTLDKPSSGTVLYDGDDVFAMSDRAITSFRNKRIGFVFQFHHLLPEFTALENVTMPLLIGGAMTMDEARVKAAGLLADLGLKARSEHRPGELSGGEQQRVAVARALVTGPDVVLADEPTGNLDTGTGDELFGLIEEINKARETTFVIVTHNESLSKRCHRVIEMKDGRISGNE